MNQRSIAVSSFKTVIGELLIAVFENKLVLCDWKHRKMRSNIDNRISKALNANFIEERTSYHLEVEKQLLEYLASERKAFTLDFLLFGSEFQKSIWSLLTTIPYGTTLSYDALSTLHGNPLAIRAIATANGANALSLIVPCHRIIGKDGSLVGYAGGLKAKQSLLEIENKFLASQIKLFE